MLDDLIKQFKELIFNNKEIKQLKSKTKLEQLKDLDTDVKSNLFVAPLKGDFKNSGDYFPGIAINATHQKGHPALDLRQAEGSPVLSISSGIVIQVSNTPKGGINISIKHDKAKGYTSYYAHLASASVKTGQAVKIGEQIGTVGGTGSANGFPHLHIEIKLNGSHVNPHTIFNAPKYTSFNKKTEKLKLT